MKTITVTDEMYEKLQQIGYTKNTDINGALDILVMSELGDDALSEDEKECNYIRFLVEQYFVDDIDGVMKSVMSNYTRTVFNEYLNARFVTKDRMAEKFAWSELYPELERPMKNGLRSRADFDMVAGRL